jgi:hypothetical protein
MPMADNLLALETLFDQANELQEGNVLDGYKLVHFMSIEKRVCPCGVKESGEYFASL